MHISGVPLSTLQFTPSAWACALFVPLLTSRPSVRAASDSNFIIVVFLCVYLGLVVGVDVFEDSVRDALHHATDPLVDFFENHSNWIIDQCPKHVRLYGLDYKKRLEKVGFKVKTEEYIQELDEKEIRYYALNDPDTIYFCTK